MIEPIENYLKFDPFWGDNYKAINSEQYMYIWGGCIYDKQKKIITKYVNKKGTHVADVYYRPSIFEGWDCLEVWVADKFMGYMSYNFTTFAAVTSGSDYWLNGIKKSMEIVMEQKAAQEKAFAKAEQQKQEIIKNKEKEMDSNFEIIEGTDYHDRAAEFLNNFIHGGH